MDQILMIRGNISRKHVDKLTKNQTDPLRGHNKQVGALSDLFVEDRHAYTELAFFKH